MDKFCPVKSSNDSKSIDPSLCPVKGQNTDRYKNPNQVLQNNTHNHISIYLYLYSNMYIFFKIFFQKCLSI